MPDSRSPYPVRVWRYFAIVSLIFVGAAIASVAFGRLSLQSRARVASRWNRVAARSLGVRLRVSGQVELPDRPVLLVANHVSWLDIPVVSAVRPVRFVSKDDVQAWPLMGWLATRTGTLYLNRGSGRAAHRMAATLATALGEGQRVVIFPEGTTTDGSHVLPFKPMLLQAAIDAGACVVPMSLHYSDHTGRPTQAAAFIGDMSFVDTLRNIVAARGLQAEVVLHPPIDSVGLDRNLLAAMTESAIATAVAERRAGERPSG
jgi:1-acyl-sn-glycerol-3-phosphate acyltransferase